MGIIRPHQYNLLLPQRRQEWRTPSQAQPKDQLGNENRTRFKVTARLADGAIRWRGWLADREDFDAFLHALANHIASGGPMPRSTWDLPSPGWHPDIEPGVLYAADTVMFFSTGTTSATPGDFDIHANHAEAIGGGASGGCASSPTNATSGGGGGEYRRVNNLNPGASLDRAIGQGGTGVSRNVSGQTSNGNAGTATTFKTSLLIANPGQPGTAGGSSAAGGAGGSGGTGADANNNGGRGGNASASNASTGGGAAGGPGGVGGNGGDQGAAGQTKGGNSATGTGSNGVTGATPSSAGGNGTDWDASDGAGAGSGAANGSSSAATSGPGGNYGGASGGARGSANSAGTSGNGIQGLLVLTYTPIGASPMRRRSPNSMIHLRR